MQNSKNTPKPDCLARQHLAAMPRTGRRSSAYISYLYSHYKQNVQMDKHLCILMPLFEDWENARNLVSSFESLPGFPASMAEFILVNDGSLSPSPFTRSASSPVTILHLNHNVGHQKAIAVGLAYIYQHRQNATVMVMDADGQDAPAAGMAMLNMLDPQSIEAVVAKRKRRPESLAFRTAYQLFRFFFRRLAGRDLSFGNFSVMGPLVLSKLVFRYELWNHYGATLLKLNIPVKMAPTDRSPRREGVSKMRYSGLLLHAMNAFLVFIDRIAIKLSLLSLFMVFISALLALIVVLIRVFTNLAIPGWASTLFSNTIILFMQGFLLGIVTLFMFLIAQRQKGEIPASNYTDYILNTESV